MYQRNIHLLSLKSVAIFLIMTSAVAAESDLHEFGEVTNKKLNENFEILEKQISNANKNSATAARTLDIEYRNCDASGSNSTYCSASCSSGYKVIGGGCSAEGGASYSQISASRPMEGNNGWYCKTSIDKQDKGTAEAKGYAICVK